MVRSVVINLVKFTKRVTFVVYLTLGSHACPEVWRPIFCKSKKDLYLVQKYVGQYV